jgi:cellulose biosynthesis protein BcsQ
MKHKNFFKEKGFDLILIDTPPTISSLTQESLTISDYYLIPSKPEFLAVEGVSQAMGFCKGNNKQRYQSGPYIFRCCFKPG